MAFAVGKMLRRGLGSKNLFQRVSAPMSFGGKRVSPLYCWCPRASTDEQLPVFRLWF